MNNDLISRSALLEEVNRTFDAFIRDAYFSAACDAMRARNAVNHMLNDAPAVDAEPVRHGRWEVGKSDFGWAEDIDCSECGSMYSFFKKPNYCPNCGARMDGGAEDADD